MLPILSALHYALPVTVFLYYICASAFSILFLQVVTFSVSQKVKNWILTLTLFVILGYVAESAVISTQIFTELGRLSSRDYNIFVLSQLLVWALFLACLCESDKHKWYPYWGAWVITLASEIVLMTLSLNVMRPTRPLEWTQISLQLFRILATSSLIVVYFSHSYNSTGSVEEETPLLSDQEATKPKLSSKLGLDLEETNDETIAAIADEEAAEKARKRKERLEKLNARLEEEGNWISYFRGFSVFFPYIWPTKRPMLVVNIAATIVLLLVERALNILVPRQYGIVIDSLGDRNSAVFGQLGTYALLSWLNSYSGIGGLRDRVWLPVESNARVSLETASYNHIMSLSCDFHDEKQTGELFAGMYQGNAVVSLLELFLKDLLPLVIDLTLALLYFYVLFDSYLVLIGAFTMVFYIWSSIFVANRQMNVQRKMNASIRRQHEIMYATMGEWKTVSYFNRITHAKKMYGAAAQYWRKLWEKLEVISFFGIAFSHTLLDLGSFAASFYGVYCVVFGNRSVGAFVTLISYWGTFTSPIIMLARVHRGVLRNLVDTEELLSLYRTVPSIQDGPNELQITDAEVIFDKVGFDYSARSGVIKELSFKAEPGKTIALIGETGAGKSTILKLLFRFYDVTEGAIYIDGQDIRNVTLESLREKIGVVPQDSSLFNDTIMSNVRFARLGATDEEVYEACKAAAIHEKILTFPDGYMSTVGEKGVKLSGGEVQRIAIARAILKDPKIILLDEATSSVDNDTEAKIQAGLRRLCQGRTTFVVAHRLSTIMEADTIIVMDGGRVLEQGAPAELMKKKGKYYSLWSKQLDLVDTLTKGDDQADLLIDLSSSSRSSTVNGEDSPTEGANSGLE